nr:protein YgfX [uncultured Pseudomonas sp.]
MSSPSEAFECRWRPSPGLLTLYALIQLLALCSLYWVEIVPWARFFAVALCVAHACWVVPRHLLFSVPEAYTALRHGAQGWQVGSAACGWQSIELRPDSLALPLIVVLRFRLSGQRRVRALCIACDGLPRDVHRRLRVRLKFSRRRWGASK